MATFSNGRIACDEEGKIIAAEYDVALDHGAYGFVPIFLKPDLARLPRIQHPQLQGAGAGRLLQPQLQHVVTAGFGSPQISTTTEALIDMCAEKAGIDPWEFRYRNAARPGDLTNQQPAVFELPLSQAAGDGQTRLRQIQGRGRGRKGPKAGTWASG